MMRNYRFQTLILIFLLPYFSALLGEVPDAEYIEIVKEYKLQPDGNVIFSYHHKLRLNSYFAINRHYGETFIVYNPEFQTLEVKKSETTMVDGKKIESRRNAFNEVLPRFFADAVSFNHLREMVITHIGLERGCTVDLSYVIQTDKEFLPGLMGEEIFADFSPIHRMIVRVIIPNSENLNYEFFNSDIESEVETQNNSKIYTWILKDLPGIAVEKNQPEWGEFAPRLIFSTVDSWDIIFDYLNLFMGDSLKLSASVRQIVDKLLEEILDSKSRMLRLQQLVSDEMGSVNCEPWLYGFKTKSAEKVFMENVGSGWDKAILLTALLKYSGVKSYPALVSRYKEFSSEVPSLHQFDDFVVFCSHPEMQKIYLSPICYQEGDLMPSISGKTLFDVRKTKKHLKRIKSSENTDNYQRMLLTLKLDDSLLIAGNGNFAFGGYSSKSYKFSSDNNCAKEEIESSISNLHVDEMEINRLDDKGSEFYAELSSSEGLAISDSYIKWKLPEFSNGFNNLSISTGQTERFSPLKLPVAFLENYEISIEIPDNLALITPLIKKKLRNGVGETFISIYKEGNVIGIKRCLILRKSEIMPVDYSDFRSLIVLWQDSRFRKIVFERSN